MDTKKRRLHSKSPFYYLFLFLLSFSYGVKMESNVILTLTKPSKIKAFQDFFLYSHSTKGFCTVVVFIDF